MMAFIRTTLATIVGVVVALVSFAFIAVVFSVITKGNLSHLEIVTLTPFTITLNIIISPLLGIFAGNAIYRAVSKSAA